MSEIRSLICDRCQRRIDITPESLKAWARFSYQYLVGGGNPITWDICPNCRLLLENALIQLRLIEPAQDQKQFSLELSLAHMADEKATR